MHGHIRAMVLWNVVLLMLGLAHGEHAVCSADEPCPSGSSCSPHSSLCVVDPPQTDKLHVWLGSNRNCDRSPSDCIFFDMLYDVSSVHDGNGGWCRQGEKVRCIVKDPPAQADATPANVLEVLTYNVFERSWFITLDGQRERTCRLPQLLVDKWPQLDVIVFQEVFMGGCFSGRFSNELDLKQMLTLYGFTHHTDMIRSPLKVEPGGVFIASRWPILDQDQHVFEASDVTSWDFFSAKGVSYAKIEKTVNGERRIYHVSGTHMQAGGPNEVKFGQAQEWYDFIMAKEIPAREPVIYAGDLNVNYWGSDIRWREVSKILHAEQPILESALNASANPIVNDLLQLKGNTGWGSWIDHVLYNYDHLAPKVYFIEIHEGKLEVEFPICWCEECVNPLRSYVYPNDSNCKRVEYVRSLGDHLPVLGVFAFP